MISTVSDRQDITNERENLIYYRAYKSRKTAGDEKTDKMDLPVCKAVLAGHDFLYSPGSYRNISFSGGQSGFEGSC